MSDGQRKVRAGQVWVGPATVEYQVLGTFEDYVWASITGGFDRPNYPKEPKTYTREFFRQKGMRLKYDLSPPAVKSAAASLEALDA